MFLQLLILCFDATPANICNPRSLCDVSRGGCLQRKRGCCHGNQTTRVELWNLIATHIWSPGLWSSPVHVLGLLRHTCVLCARAHRVETCPRVHARTPSRLRTNQLRVFISAPRRCSLSDASTGFSGWLREPIRWSVTGRLSLSTSQLQACCSTEWVGRQRLAQVH